MTYDTEAVKRSRRLLLGAILLATAGGTQPLTPREEGALAGANVGTATGGTVGALQGTPQAGAEIGSRVGAAAGVRLAERGENVPLARSVWKISSLSGVAVVWGLVICLARSLLARQP